MGIKLEYILAVLIIITIFITTTVRLEDIRVADKSGDKELEFMNSTFVEVDKERLLARLYTTYGVKKAGILTMDDIKYNTDNIKRLWANKGTYRGDILYLDGNVTLEDKDGYIYTTEHAQYDQKSEILNITSNFIAHMNQNIFKGTALEYKSAEKVSNATRVNAIVYTEKKQ